MIDCRAVPERFFIVAHERGQTGEALPTWSNQGDSPIEFNVSPAAVTRAEVEHVPGTFQLCGLLSPAEAEQFIRVAEQLGFHRDAPLQQPAYLRHNDNLNWVVDDMIVGRLWDRAASSVSETVNGQAAWGLNARFRFYRYRVGDRFARHEDVSWPGSRIVDGRLVENFDPTLRSHYTFLIFLNDDFEGGATQFEVRHGDIESVDVRTPVGAALCFPHGTHPDQCVHASAPISRGTKYVIRTDILFGSPA